MGVGVFIRILLRICYSFDTVNAFSEDSLYKFAISMKYTWLCPRIRRRDNRITGKRLSDEFQLIQIGSCENLLRKKNGTSAAVFDRSIGQECSTLPFRWCPPFRGKPMAASPVDGKFLNTIILLQFLTFCSWIHLGTCNNFRYARSR